MSLVKRFAFRKSRSGISVAELMRKGLLDTNRPVSARGMVDKVDARLLQTGEVVWNGQLFGSPSHFARTALGKKKCNGWTYTMYLCPRLGWQSLESIREKYKKQEAKKEPEVDVSPYPKPLACGEKLGYIYLFHTRACINGKENVYKVGKTTRPIDQRLREYDKGTIHKGSFPVPGRLVSSAERCVLRALRRNFLSRRDYGSEYFEGDMFKIFRCLSTTLESFLERRSDQKITKDI